MNYLYNIAIVIVTVILLVRALGLIASYMGKLSRQREYLEWSRRLDTLTIPRICVNIHYGLYYMNPSYTSIYRVRATKSSMRDITLVRCSDSHIVGVF